MSARLLAVNLLLAAATALLSNQLARTLSAPRFLPPPRLSQPVPSATSARDEPAPGSPPLAAYGIVASRNLFSPDRSDVVAQPPAQPQAPPAPKPLLYGVVINETSRLAYLEDPASKRVFGYRIGETVAGGQIEQIEEDHVVIKRSDGPIEVKLTDPSQPKPAATAPGAATPSPARPGVTAPAPGTPVPGTPPAAGPPRVRRPASRYLGPQLPTTGLPGPNP